MEAKQLTKIEILDWIASQYTSETRSMRKGLCCYFGQYGRRCAISKMCKDDEETEKALREIDLFDYPAIGDCDDYIMPLMKPEFAGHEVEFYTDCQGLHDIKSNWDELGLSKTGLNKLRELKDKWADPQ